MKRTYTSFAQALGTRHEQQDRVFMAPLWGILCDGMGGHDYGAEAAEVAVAAVDNALRCALHTEHVLSSACTAVEVLAGGRTHRKPGTTLIYYHLIGGPGVKVVHVGDSRAYKLALGADKLERLTKDHNVAQGLIDAGLPVHANAASTILSMIPDMDGYTDTNLKLDPGDYLILASDGFYDVMERHPERFVKLLQGVDFRTCGTDLAQQALDLYLTDYDDNATLLILRRLE